MTVCHCSKMPDGDGGSLMSATRLLEKHREMVHVEHALNAHKEVDICYVCVM